MTLQDSPNDSSTPARKKQSPQTFAELVSSFGIRQSSTSASPTHNETSCGSQQLANGERPLARPPAFSFAGHMPGTRSFHLNGSRGDAHHGAQTLGPPSSTMPISVDSGDHELDELDPTDDHTHDSQPHTSGRTYSSPIYLVDEDSDTDEMPSTPTKQRASPSSPKYLLSGMSGEESTASELEIPGSPSLRRSHRSKTTPKTYSLKKLTFPERTPRHTSKSQLHSNLPPSPLRSPVKELSARKRVREEIARVTKVKRDQFLKHFEALFLPVLPEQNYFAHLESQSKIIDYVKLTEQPAGVTATLKHHQMDGLSFLVHMHRNGMPCILGDEMGLGKTLQTLSLFSWVEERSAQDAEHRPYLVVCPLTVLNSWVSEATKWTPGLKVLRLHGSKPQRHNLKRAATGQHQKPSNGEREEYKIIVTTYETFVAEQSWFKTAFVWRYVVLDEGHILKNSKTQVAKTFQSISSEFRLILTGTPLQNDLTELWSILHWLLPDVFSDKTRDLLGKSFNLARGSVDISMLDNLRKLLELLMLRRLKNSPGVDLDLPPKTEVLLYVPLTPLQRTFYMRLITHQGDFFLDEVFADTREKEHPSAKPSSPASASSRPEKRTPDEKRNNSSDYRRLMNLVMQLRKCCNHPYLLPKVQPDTYELGQHLIKSSGKFIVLEKLLRELILVQKKKVLIFSGFTGMLDLTEDLIAFLDAFKTLRIDGQCGRAGRNLMMRLFNNPKSEYSVMLISTKAGGLGITLNAANEIIFLDQDWNPQVTLQAEARAHRIGQKNPVTIYKLCTQGTVEEQMMGRIEKKLYLSARITESMNPLHNTVEFGQPTAEISELGKTQLMSLLRRGAQTLTTPVIDVADMTSWNFEQILANCKPMDPAIAETEVDEEGWLNRMERVETAIFDGRRIERDNGTLDVPVEMKLDRRQRRMGKSKTVEVDGFLVSRESLECADWEAVPTLAGKDPSLASPKRKKKSPVHSQTYCQVCWDDGEMIGCSLCPRSYHRDCLRDDPAKSSPIKGQYICPQHRCLGCNGTSSQVGGLLYRCRFCTAAYCEDCLDFDHVQLIDFSLPELEVLDYGSNSTAFFIKCQACIDLHFVAPELRTYSQDQMKMWETTWDDFRKQQEPAAKLERKDSMNPLCLSSGQEDDGPTRSTTLADFNDTTEPSTSWSNPCQSPTKRSASPYNSPTPHDPTGSPKGSPSKKLKYN